MKLNRLIQPAALSILLALGSTACKHSQIGTTPLGDGKNGLRTSSSSLSGDAKDPGASGQLGDPGSADGKVGSIDNGKGTEGIGFTKDHRDWAKDAEALKAQTVHFAYDSSVVKDSEKSKLSAVADYLKANAEKAIEIDGHCDEKGTDEYNRSLGERRALSIREELAHMGVDASRVDTISFGRDRPIDTGHSEAAHSRNRRGEFIVLTHP
jgi:peptidoglycan-associated lipoprotein